MNDVLMAMLLSQSYERLKGWLQRGNDCPFLMQRRICWWDQWWVICRQLMMTHSNDHLESCCLLMRLKLWFQKQQECSGLLRLEGGQSFSPVALSVRVSSSLKCIESWEKWNIWINIREKFDPFNWHSLLKMQKYFSNNISTKNVITWQCDLLASVHPDGHWILYCIESNNSFLATI